MALLGLPVGMLIALVLTELFYDVRDTYFTNDAEAMAVCAVKSIILLAITIFTDFGALVCGATPWTSTDASPIATRSSMKDFCSQAFRLRTFAISLELAVSVTALFMMLEQPENLTNSFRFTSQDAKILLTYYVMGTAFGCIACPSLIESFGTTTRVMWASVLTMILACGLMLFQIDGADLNVTFISICQIFIGGSIMTAIVANIKHIGVEMTVKETNSEKNAYLACVIGLSGLAAAILCFLGDFLYYLNRNSLIWAYLESSAFPVGFLLISAIIHYFLASLFPAVESETTEETTEEETTAAANLLKFGA